MTVSNYIEAMRPLYERITIDFDQRTTRSGRPRPRMFIKNVTAEELEHVAPCAACSTPMHPVRGVEGSQAHVAVTCAREDNRRCNHTKAATQAYDDLVHEVGATPPAQAMFVVVRNDYDTDAENFLGVFDSLGLATTFRAEVAEKEATNVRYYSIIHTPFNPAA